MFGQTHLLIDAAEFTKSPLPADMLKEEMPVSAMLICTGKHFFANSDCAECKRMQKWKANVKSVGVYHSMRTA
jgi:hypothetical protein